MVRGETLTVAQLKVQAKKKGIKGYSTMKKAELIKVLGTPKIEKKTPNKKKVIRKSTVKKSKGKMVKAKSPKVQYKWQWKSMNYLDPASIVLSSGGSWSGWMDFEDDISGDIEMMFNEWQRPDGTMKQRVFGIDFKKMAIEWFLKLPIGGSLSVVDPIRRVKV